MSEKISLDSSERKEEISIKIKDSVCMDKLYTKNTIDITSENLD